jgi:CDP-glucose 4,6-dehydratase
MISHKFWKGKRIFLTGHTGFKGSWLSLWLFSLGADVKGYSLNPQTSPSLFNEAKVDSIVNSKIGDIRDLKTLSKSMEDFNPDILIHMAAQSLVRYSYNNPVETYEVNVIGTVNVLEAARGCPNLKAIINVTTDKCYENDNRVQGYKENDVIGGYDPYSSSKGCSELVTSCYRRSFLQEKKVGLASVRSGNVIGGGDWSDDRLIPDILRAFELNEPVIVRNPNATRPWQHVLEPLSGYLILSQKLYNDFKEYSQSWNFGPDDKDVRPVNWILDHMVSSWPDASWNIDNSVTPYESALLKLDTSKAREKLNWKPLWKLEKSLERIIYWHKAWKSDEDMQLLCLSEIKDYMKDMINEKC